MKDLVSRTSLSEGDARALRRHLDSYLTVIPSEAVRGQMALALRIMDTIDRGDAPYLAAALAVSCDGIWSDDPHLKAQSVIPCWTTKELVEALRDQGLPI